MKFEAGNLAEADFDFLCRLIYEKSRIRLGPDKRTLVASRLAKRLRQLQLPDYHEYCQLLRSPAGEAELRFLIDRISTNHTHFFREIKHFDHLRDKLLPAWKMRGGKSGEVYRVWSAACSTGEEPYSIAIYLADFLGPAAAGLWQIEATDISTRVLETAERGVYDQERLRDVKSDQLHRHFQKGQGNWLGYFRIKGDLRACIHFHHLNLLENKYPFTQPFHLIWCRNVMIYFDRPTQEALIGYLASRLVSGGCLMVGHSESLSGIQHSLRLVQPAVYTKS